MEEIEGEREHIMDVGYNNMCKVYIEAKTGITIECPETKIELGEDDLRFMLSILDDYRRLHS